MKGGGRKSSLLKDMRLRVCPRVTRRNWITLKLESGLLRGFVAREAAWILLLAELCEDGAGVEVRAGGTGEIAQGGDGSGDAEALSVA